MWFLNWWWIFWCIFKESENEPIRRKLKSQIDIELSKTQRRFDNLIIEFENNSEISKKIRQKYNEFKEFNSHIWRTSNWNLIFRNDEKSINTMKKCLLFIEKNFDWFLSKYENHNTSEQEKTKKKTKNNDSISKLCESYWFSKSKTKDKKKEEINFFEKKENQELWKTLLEIWDEMWLRWKNWETNFWQETKAFITAIQELSNYPKIITFMCRDKWYDFNSKEVQHLVKCYKKWKKLILDNKDFFSKWNWNLEKAKKIINELNDVSFELFDEWFYEIDMLMEFDEKYWPIEHVKWFELIEEAKNL